VNHAVAIREPKVGDPVLVVSVQDDWFTKRGRNCMKIFWRQTVQQAEWDFREDHLFTGARSSVVGAHSMN
jgi:hypothetical protein